MRPPPDGIQRIVVPAVLAALVIIADLAAVAYTKLICFITENAPGVARYCNANEEALFPVIGCVAVIVGLGAAAGLRSRVPYYLGLALGVAGAALGILLLDLSAE